MPSVQEHLAVGFALSECLEVVKRRYSLDFPNRWIIVLASAISDFDVIPGWIIKNNIWYYHREFSHSLLFIILGGLFAVWFYRKRKHTWLIFLLFSAMLFTHIIVLDYFLTPYKIQFFWPLGIYLPPMNNHILTQLESIFQPYENTRIIALCGIIFIYFKNKRNNFIYQLINQGRGLLLSGMKKA
jgi:membrane-bound metal-dependent hydrolase YbcI (DUF457 family)